MKFFHKLKIFGLGKSALQQVQIVVYTDEAVKCNFKLVRFRLNAGLLNLNGLFGQNNISGFHWTCSHLFSQYYEIFFWCLIVSVLLMTPAFDLSVSGGGVRGLAGQRRQQEDLRGLEASGTSLTNSGIMFFPYCFAFVGNKITLFGNYLNGLVV